MRWASALLTGVVCATAGAFLAYFVGDAVAEAYRVSSFEGGRGYLVVFIYAPLGLLAGLVVGILVARVSHGAGLGGFLKAQGLALLITGAVIGGVGGLAILATDKPPTQDGRNLVLEFEIRIPTDQPVPDDLKGANLRSSLYEGPKANQSADLQFDAVTRQDGFVTVPGTATLLTHNPSRMLQATLGSGPSHVWELPLPGSPGATNSAWTVWLKNRDPLGDSEVWTGARYQLRYRVALVPPTT